MLSPRAAAFSVQALLTGPEDSAEDRLPSGAKTKGNEDVSAEEVLEGSKSTSSEANEAVATRHQNMEDSTRREKTPPWETHDGMSKSKVPSPTGAESADDEDLLVDVEDCSSSSELHVHTFRGKEGGRQGFWDRPRYAMAFGAKL